MLNKKRSTSQKLNIERHSNEPDSVHGISCNGKASRQKLSAVCAPAYSAVPGNTVLTNMLLIQLI